MAIVFEVGAAFIVEDRASASLAEIGRAFERLDALAVSAQEKLATLGETAFGGLKASADRAYSEVQRLIAQAAELGRAWERAGAMGAGPGGRGRGGGAGGSGGGNEAERDAAAALREARLNANTENANINQIYNRDAAAARREDDNFNRLRDAQNERNRNPNGPYGPQLADPATGWDQGQRMNEQYNNEQRRNAEEEQRRILASERAADERRSKREAVGNGIVGQGIEIGSTILGIKSAEHSSKNEQDINQLLSAMGITEDRDPVAYHAAYARMENLSHTAALGTKFPEQKTSEFLREALPAMFLSGEDALKGAEAVGPLALKLGEASAQRGHGQAGREGVSAIDIAHLAGRWKPEEINAEFDAVNEAARVTGTSINEQLRILKYAVPIATAAGIDPQTALFDVTSAEVRLGNTTTAGSGYSRFVMGAQTFRGDAGHGDKGHRANAARGYERELHDSLMLQNPKEETHDSNRSKEHLKAQDEARMRLGIFDKAGHVMPGARGADGGVDMEKVKGLIAAYAADPNTPKAGPGSMLMTGTDAFGVQGWRYGEAYAAPGYIAREKAQRETQKTSTSVEDELKVLQHGSEQRFEQMVARLSDTGQNLLDPALKDMASAFGQLTTRLTSFSETVRGLTPESKGLLAKAEEGASIGAAIGAFAGAVGLGPVGVVAGTAIGAGVGATTAVGAHILGRSTWNTPNPEFGGPPLDMPALPPGPPTPSASTQAMQNVVNNISLTISGLFDIDTMKAKVMEFINGAFKTGMTTSGADPHGSVSSVYTQPGFGF